MERRSTARSGKRLVSGQPTLRTIADLTGLGVTTVSRALKDGPELAIETKARVRAIAEEIGYRPHRAGVRLKTGRTFVISFVLNQADDMSDYARRLKPLRMEIAPGICYRFAVLKANNPEMSKETKTLIRQSNGLLIDVSERLGGIEESAWNRQIAWLEKAIEVAAQSRAA